MTPETWLAFSAASLVLLLIPGPTILLVMSLRAGPGLACGLADGCGRCARRFHGHDAVHAGDWRVADDLCHRFHSAEMDRCGLSRWLGIKLFRAGGTFEARAETTPTSRLKMLGHAWLVTALNPKSITFFVAFLPQFIDPKQPLLPQMVIFELTFLIWLSSMPSPMRWSLPGADIVPEAGSDPCLQPRGWQPAGRGGHCHGRQPPMIT